MRKRRILCDGATYHVTSQFDHGAMGLMDDKMKALLVSFIAKAKGKFHCKIWNLVLMDNHFHILIRPDEKVASLSEVMRWLKGNFAKAWNKAHGCKGHVWGERFFSRIIENMCDFARTMEYIDENPVKAGLVVRATDWVYGRLHKLKQGLTGVLDLIDVAPATL